MLEVAPNWKVWSYLWRKCCQSITVSQSYFNSRATLRLIVYRMFRSTSDVKKSITSSFFNRIIFHLAVRCRTFQEINVWSLKLKFQTIPEKMAKNFRGLLYFAAPGRWWCSSITIWIARCWDFGRWPVESDWDVDISSSRVFQARGPATVKASSYTIGTKKWK